MRVVSNTSPLSNLATIGRLDLLREQLGLAHTGVLGVLRQARRTNRIASLKAGILRLRSEAHFFVNPALEKRLLISVGE